MSTLPRMRRRPATIDELIGSPYEGRFELVEGKLEGVGMSPFTSSVAYLLGLRIGEFLQQNPLGRAFESETYYHCFGKKGTGRKPDLSVVRAERLPSDWQDVGYFTFPPDLAVEVVSPGDRADRVKRKIQDYRQAGVRLLWVIYPKARTADVFYPGGYEEVAEDQELQGRDVLPGFRVKLGDLFPSPPSPTTPAS
jgi:Uma2 family endonuclease